MQSARLRWTRPIIYGILVGLIVVAGVENAILFSRSRNLHTIYGLIGRASHLRVGVKLPNLVGRDIAGEPVEISFAGGDRKTLILVHSEQCGACKANWSKWDKLLSSQTAEKYRLVFIEALSTKAEFLKSHRLSSALVVVRPRPSSLAVNRLAATPQTILVDEAGRVLVARASILGDADIKQFLE